MTGTKNQGMFFGLPDENKESFVSFGFMLMFVVTLIYPCRIIIFLNSNLEIYEILYKNS